MRAWGVMNRRTGALRRHRSSHPHGRSVISPKTRQIAEAIRERYYPDDGVVEIAITVIGAPRKASRV